MSPDKINRMINQIATFFESQPDVDKAGRVADHLKEFWEPRMLDFLATQPLLLSALFPLADPLDQNTNRVLGDIDY